SCSPSPTARRTRTSTSPAPPGTAASATTTSRAAPASACACCTTPSPAGTTAPQRAPDAPPGDHAVLDLVLALSPERFASLYGALPVDISTALDGAIARMLNSRVASVRKQPEALRAKALRAFLVRTRDEAVAGDVLRAYFLGPRLPLVTA